MQKTPQISKWVGKFGRDYTERNILSVKELDKSYIKKYGVTRKRMNLDFIGNISKNGDILEIGSNVGNQLIFLQHMGYKNLFGIEPMLYAREKAKQFSHDINIIKGDVFNIPFKDKFFDLVFTSDVLIHISPKNIKKALQEIYRCSNKYIWGFEYYAPFYQEINYRGEKQLLWKTDFPKIYMSLFPDLKLVKLKYYEYKQDDNKDVMFLFKKRGR